MFFPIALLTLPVAVGPLLALLALHLGAWFLAVRADLEADVALDLVLALTRGFGGGWPGAHRFTWQLEACLQGNCRATADRVFNQACEIKSQQKVKISCGF